MREIKFRAWLIYAKRMYEWHPKFFSDISPVVNYGGQIFINDDTRFYLMQFTGLKDSNKKEVYEGDIINDGYGGHVVYDEELAGFYIENSHAMRLSLHDELQTSLTGDKRFIIGNIYENPDLLKST